MAQRVDQDVLQSSLLKLSGLIKKRQISPMEVTRKLLERIEALNPKLNAYITVVHEKAMESALQAEKEIAAGNWKGPLHGIPIGLKDLIYTKEIKTTMGSAIYKDHIPGYDAAVVEKLKQAGAIIIGKLNTHQFAYGPTGDRSFFGAVKNPYNLSKIPGGSSSGSGASVAASMCFAALGTDTGGSIRIPSACCGIVGMKPTFGRVSKYGVFPLSWTLDHVGAMTKTVQDNAILLNVLSGYDERDPYSVKVKDEDFTRLLHQGVIGSIIGIPSTFYFENVDSEVEKQVRQAVEVFRSLGAEIRIIEIPHLKQISLAQQITIESEAYAVHEEILRNHSKQYDEEVKTRLLKGLSTKAYEYVQAQQVKQLAITEFNHALKEVEMILTPTLPILPTDIGQREINIHGYQEQVRTALMRFTKPTNLNGFPSLSIPCGFSNSGLPIGLQLIGRPYDEANLYRFAYAFEQEYMVSPLKMEID
jgi:aspartyl-tRNA(Asn)/glutamyl-tRNA(Gln) amidotransferase subunit A